VRNIASGKTRSKSTTFWALKDVSFDVNRGEVVGIIGRNGAGKSTLLKIFSRITEPTAGEVDLRGRVGSLLEVGTGFHPELTGRENIFLNGSILGMKRAEISRQFDAIVDFAEVEKFLDTPVKHYSSGMYTRLAFAVAAHLEPEILIIDEVLAVGDAAFQKKCLGKMGEVARGGRTVLFVSHQMAMVETLCTRAILLEQGRVAMSGGTSEVVRSYLTALADTASASDISSLPRTGSGEFVVKKFWVEDETGRPVPAVASGARVTLAFEYEATVGAASRASLGFGILGMDEKPVTLLYNDYQGDGFQGIPSTGVVRFTFPRLPLSNGSYYVAVRTLVNGAEADWPRGYVGRLEVDAGDFYGVGHPFHSGICATLVEGDWKLDPVDA
jgi:lipopolysaccharide transport system ATP-binding protein